MNAVAYGPKIPLRTRVQGSWEKRSAVFAFIADRICFSPNKATQFETMMTTMNEVNRDKTKVPDEFNFVVFGLSVLLPNSMSKLIHNRCTCMLINKTIRLYTCMRTKNSCFSLLFSVVQLWKCDKTVIQFRLSEYCRMTPETNIVQ